MIDSIVATFSVNSLDRANLRRLKILSRLRIIIIMTAVMSDRHKIASRTGTRKITETRINIDKLANAIQQREEDSSHRLNSALFRTSRISIFVPITLQLNQSCFVPNVGKAGFVGVSFADL
jgi:hypothetical protein